MREELIKIANKKGFKSKSIKIKSQLLVSDFDYYIWMCELQRWLRDEHEIYVNLKAFNSNENIEYFSEYYDFKNLTIKPVCYAETYEKALEKGLQEALKLIE